MVLNSESQRHGSVSTNVCTAFICTVERETIDSHRVGRGPRFYPDCPIFHLASAAAAFFDTLFLFPDVIKPRLRLESKCVPRDIFCPPRFCFFLSWLLFPPPPFLAGLFLPRRRFCLFFPCVAPLLDVDAPLFFLGVAPLLDVDAPSPSTLILVPLPAPAASLSPDEPSSSSSLILTSLPPGEPSSSKLISDR